jgi:Helix-turn-helix domain
MPSICVALWTAPDRTIKIDRVTGGFQLFPDSRLGNPGEPINVVLRAVRKAAGLSLDVLATRTNFSKSYLSNVEAGRRRVTANIAEAYDVALGTGGLLGQLLLAHLSVAWSR